ncbi:helix-turn-helix transcriptional regulator [Flavobacterium branchiarum]|uniref:Helix-turn-helix domain-containing protein n=1 Tax=Flavobacterium branchiarum TaxID=1114870 RepID=A0ABV5FH05_9FLAO|nr:helix-turn-helix transcriptional regulator [Flavobacterium branchiarum]MDN3671780.1 helix-turn-helix transcriptional regulator [Flavobacterium branchiarum]
MSTVTKPKHIGRNISRIRELRGMKQEALATAIGVSQQSISNIEASETVDEEKLQAIASSLGVSVEAIRDYSDEAVFNIISNTYHNTSSDNSTLIASSVNYQPTFNTVDKIVELYERLVQAEKEKVEYLEKVIKEK